MGRPVSFDFASGGGSTAEFLMGEVEIEPTLMHSIGTRIVLPDTVTLPLINGKAIHPDMAVSPAGPEPAWAYKITVRSGITGRADSSGRAWAEFRGVPNGTTQIAYKDLPKFVTTIPPQTTAAMMQNWADTTRGNAERSEAAADRAEAPTDQMNSNLIHNPESLTSKALTETIGGLSTTISVISAREQAELRVALEVASHAYANFEIGRFSQWGAKVKAKAVTDSVDGKVRPAITNLLADRVPLVATGPGVIPAGWEKSFATGHQAPGNTVNGEFTYEAYTNAAARPNISGIRTTNFPLSPGTEYAVALDMAMTNPTTTDLYKATLGVQRANGTTFTFSPSWQYPTEEKSRGYRRFTTPAGTDMWRLTISGTALDNVDNVGGMWTIGNPMVYVAPNLPVGYDFFGCAVEARTTAKTVVLKELLPSTRYLLMMRTTQAGLVTIYATSTSSGTINLLSVFPGGTIDVLEIWALPPAEYREGMATAAAELSAYEAVRHLDGADWPHSQPESAQLVAQATGLMRNFAHPQNPKGPRSINLDQRRLHHVKFRTLPGEAFIGDSTGGNSSQRTELGTGYEQPFNTTLWVNFGVIFHEELKDPVNSDKLSVFWQSRYIPNAGESTGFSPEVALMQRPSRKLRLQLISDNGIYQTAGTGSGPLGEPNAPVNNTTTLFDFDYEPGVYYHIWMRYAVSNTGGGTMHLKINGKTIFNQDAPAGYNRNTGPMVRFGSYKYSASPANTEFFGCPIPTTENLDALASLPVPGI